MQVSQPESFVRSGNKKAPVSVRGVRQTAAANKPGLPKEMLRLFPGDVIEYQDLLQVRLQHCHKILVGRMGQILVAVLLGLKLGI